jgi:leader peptidase (prepilin peptidase)/N-methyltransferase
MSPQDLTYILFLFVLGAAVGSFLNVVVWRLPRDESLVTPPSHCPKCSHRLAWFDNIPIFGWLLLRGKCRYCQTPISIRYPIVELATALLFVLFYVLFFLFQIGPCPAHLLAGFTLNIQDHWPLLALYLFAASALLASSLIDAELFIIPIEIPWLLAIVAIISHAIIDRPAFPGALNTTAPWSALSAGGAIGLIISAALLAMKIMPISFPRGEPILEADRAAMLEEISKSKDKPIPEELPPEYTSWQIRLEMTKEMLFLLPPLLLAGLSLLLYIQVPSIHHLWLTLSSHHWLTGLLGSCLGAMIGAFVVWFTRILGTLGFGRVAMGLGDVHLMFGVGAAIGAGASTIAFFIAPFFGLAIAVYSLITRSRRELPYGPYLSLGSVFVMFLYCPIAAYLAPGLFAIRQMLSGSF